jgi:hypothetical protein
LWHKFKPHEPSKITAMWFYQILVVHANREGYLIFYIALLFPICDFLSKALKDLTSLPNVIVDKNLLLLMR